MPIHETKVSVGSSKKSAIVETRTLSQKVFLKERVRVIADDADKDGPYFTPCEFDGTRSSENISQIKLVVLDIDKGTSENVREIIKRLHGEGIELSIYTTVSHRPDNPHYRLILEPSRLIEHYEYRTLVESLCDTYGIDGVDVGACNPAQAMFLPVVRESQRDTYKYVYKKGNPIDIDKLLSGFDLTDIKDALEEETLHTLPLPKGVPQELFITALCKVYPADGLEYDEWLEFGMALHHQTDGSDVGLRAWINWSSKSEKHGVDIDEEAMRNSKWPSFATGSTRGVTVRTILNKKNVKGMSIGRGVYMRLIRGASSVGTLDSIVYTIQRDQFLTQKEKSSLAKTYKDKHNSVEDIDTIDLNEARATLTHVGSEAQAVEVVDDELTRLPDKYALDSASGEYIDIVSNVLVSPSALNAMYGNLVPLGGQTGTSRKYVTEVLTKSLYGLDPIKVVTERTFKPGIPDRLIPLLSGTYALNTFLDKNWPKANEVDEVTQRRVNSMIDKHFTILSNGDADTKALLMSHLAYIRQYKQKLKWGISLSSAHQGVGKSMLVNLYSAVLGNSHVTTISPSLLLEPYDDAVCPAGKLVVFIEEFGFKSKRAKTTAMETLKELVTSDRKIIRRMYANASERDLTVSYIINTNQSDPLGSDRSGRRWAPVTINVHSDKQIEEIVGCDKEKFFGEYVELMQNCPHAFINFFENFEIEGRVLTRDSFKVDLEDKAEYFDNEPTKIAYDLMKLTIEEGTDISINSKYIKFPDLTDYVEEQFEQIDTEEQFSSRAIRNFCRTAIKQLGYKKLGPHTKRLKLAGTRHAASSIFINPKYFSKDIDKNVEKIRDHMREAGIIDINTESESLDF